MNDLAACVHEAGHALAAVALGVGVHHVFVTDARGACVLQAPVAEALVSADDGDGFPSSGVRAAIVGLSITLAGPAAEGLLGACHMEWTTAGCDLDAAERDELRVAEAVGVLASARSWRSLAWQPTRAFLEREWGALARLAAALAGARELCGAQVAALAGPLDPPDLTAATGFARHLWERHAARRARVEIST